MPDDHVSAGRLELRDGHEHMREQRTSGQRVQDLWQPRVHARSLACGQNDDFEGRVG